MDIEMIEKWAWDVALKKVIAATIGFFASQKFLVGISWLQAHGINVSIDTVKFQNEFTAMGIASFAGLHDYIKLKTGWSWL